MAARWSWCIFQLPAMIGRRPLSGAGTLLMGAASSTSGGRSECAPRFGGMADAGVVSSRTPGRSLSVPGWRPVAVSYGAVAVLLFLVANLAYYHLPVHAPDHGFPDYDLFNLWTRWDSDWYQHIVNNGYF